MNLPRLLSIAILVLITFAVGFAQEPSISVSKASSAAGSSGGSATSPPAISSSASRVILRVGDAQVTQAEFESMIKLLEQQQGPASLSRRTLGDNYAALLTLSRQAVAHHLETSPEVVRQLELDRTQILSNAQFAKLKQQAKPTAEEISDYYSAHQSDYDVVELRRLFIWTRSADAKDERGLSPQDAKALADAIRHAYATGGDAEKLVHEATHNPDDVVLDNEPLTFQRGELPEKMERAAAALKETEWAEVAETPGSLVYLQLVKRGRRELKEVSPQIEKKLQGQKLAAELENLKKQTGVWMDQEYFAAQAPSPASSTQSKAETPNKADAQ